ncbi:MAG: hypothetical protein IH600_01185 [Bacteroidetes bacterium]|nr:hypothetical protein [Bacteroidota bacterium]
MKNPTSALAAFTLVLFCCYGCQTASQQFPQTWGTVAFETPIPFSPPTELGLDAVSMQNPPESTPGKGKLELTLVRVSRDMAESLDAASIPLQGYLTGTFLGLSKEGEPSMQRTFLQKPVPGERISTSIPTPAEWEYYLVPLSGGNMIFIALRRDASTPADEAAQVLDMIAETLRETGTDADNDK